MGNLFSKSRERNEATLANNPRDVTLENCVVAVVSGGNVNIERQPAPSNTKEISSMKKQKRGNDPEKTLRMRTQTKSEVKITTSYRTLHEPSIQFSPQMKTISEFYGGGHFEEVRDEFKMVKQLVMAGMPITYEEFFKVITNEESKRIALIGGAGYGKTTELKKLTRKLLNKEGRRTGMSSQHHFNIVHTINLKDLRPKDSTTLQDCLFENDIPDADDRKYLLQQIVEAESDTIILIDGLDQANFDTKLEHHKVAYWDEASTETLMYNLMAGNIFPNVKVVVSSREHAISTLPEEARPEYVVALAGFKQQHAKSLFLDLVQDDSESWESIEQNLSDLLSVLVIPIYLIFTAVVYKYSKKKKEDLPAFITGLLAKIIGILPNNKNMQDNMISTLQKLKKLAYDGMKDRLLSFDEIYLNNHGLTAKEVSDLMSKIPTENMVFHRLLEKDYFYFFCHQSMEEFLAACYISEMNFFDFISFTENEFKEEFSHWSDVIQYLSGVTLNKEVQLDQNLVKIREKSKKQEMLRDALRRPPTDALKRPPTAYYMIVHESNDEELIRQLQGINIFNTPLTSNLARVISSLMRRSESMESIWIQDCGISNGLLRIMAANMEGSRLRVEKLWLLDRGWDVSCSTLCCFLANLEVNELEIDAFPTDYHDVFPNFENVKTWKTRMSGHDVIIKNDQDRVLFESNHGMSGDFNKKEKLLKLHFREQGGRDDDCVKDLKRLCSAKKVEVTKE